MQMYIIRHGQTSWNLAKRKQGHLDSPLTLKGIEQAKNTGNLILSEGLDLKNIKIVTSPLFRAKQHASILCETINYDFNSCIIEEGLKEHCFGSWEGKTEQEIEEKFPGFLSNRYKPENYWSYIIPMGESYELLYRRVSDVIEKYGTKDIIYICHEMVSKVMVGKLKNLEPEQILPLSHPQDQIYKYKNKSIYTLK
tara:strand:+ start:12452 stop:13039 length:588 start_codon:yes stop_codon:yes gene_type:complete